MALPKLPVTGLDDVNFLRRHREVTNSILTHQFDDSRVQTPAEIAAGVTPVNYAYPPGDIRRYGAMLDGVTNDASAWQAAINAVRGAAVIFPAGDSLISTTVELNFDQATTTFVREGVSIYGEGAEKSRIIARVSGGPVFKHTQSATQAAAFSFAQGCVFSDFTILGDGSTPSGCIGFQLAGMFNPVFDQVYIRELTSHGIYCPYDGALGTPDAYGNGFLALNQCTVRENDGWGILVSDSATTLIANESVVSNNATGGIFSAGSSIGRIIGGGIAGNGTSGLAGSFGIHIAYSGDASVTPHAWLIEDVEIDRNFNKQVVIHGYHCEVRRNRILDQATSLVGFTADTQVEIGTSGVFTKSNIVELNVMRLERVSGSDTTIGFSTASDSLYNDISRNLFLFSAGVTECATLGGTGNRYFDSTGLLQQQSSTQTTWPSAIAYISGSGTTALSDSSLTTVPLDAEIYDSNSAFNTGTNTFTAPATGLYRVAGHITLQDYVDGKFTQISVVVNGSTLAHVSYTLATNANNFASLPFDCVVPAAAGNAIIVQIITDTGTSAEFKQGATRSRVSFQMLQ